MENGRSLRTYWLGLETKAMMRRLPKTDSLTSKRVSANQKNNWAMEVLNLMPLLELGDGEYGLQRRRLEALISVVDKITESGIDTRQLWGKIGSLPVVVEFQRRELASRVETK